MRVARLSNYGGTARCRTFLTNDERAGLFHTQERAVLHISPGEHKFWVAGDRDGLFRRRMGARSRRTNGEELNTGRIYDFRIGFNSCDDVLRLGVDRAGKLVESTFGSIQILSPHYVRRTSPRNGVSLVQELPRGRRWHSPKKVGDVVRNERTVTGDHAIRICPKARQVL